jgi:hypothetical protein
VKNLSTLNFNYLCRVSVMALCIILILSHLMNSYLPMPLPYKQKMKIYQQNSKLIEAITIGDSHGRGIHLSALGLRGLSFSDDGGDIEEACMKADVFIEEVPNLKYLFLPLSPGTLSMARRYYEDDYKKSQLGVIRNTPASLQTFLYNPEALINNFVNRVIPIKELQQMINKLILLVALRGDTAHTTEPCFSQLSNEPIERGDSLMIDDGIVGGYFRKIMAPSCLKKYADDTVKMHLRWFENSIKKNPNIITMNMQRLIKIADKLVEHDGKLVLLITPLTKEYYESPHISALNQQHIRLLLELTQHPNIDFYDFHDFFYNAMANGNNDFFFDDDHLALPGAIKFSDALKDAMGI